MFNHTLTSNTASVGLVSTITEHKAFIISFEELYKQYYRFVYNICLRMMANTADAEDLAHDAILQAHRNLNTFRGNSTFGSWLHRVTVNQVLMYFRKSSTRREQVTYTGEIPEQIEPLTDDRPHSLPIIDRISLAAAVEKLPPGYRTVFLLYAVEGYNHEEIAQILSINPGTSKSQLHKARLRLRDILLNNSKHS